MEICVTRAILKGATSSSALRQTLNLSAYASRVCLKLNSSKNLITKNAARAAAYNQPQTSMYSVSN